MDSAPTGMRICCVKFLQKVVQVQTMGIIADPRRPEKNETSISLVPHSHPLLSLPNLEAEASGLLDRLLDVFHQDSSDAVLINASLNCASVLIKTRAAVANKIITVILNYNPLKLANSPMTPPLRVSLRSMERTTRAVLRNVNKSNPNGPLAGKIDAYLVRLQQTRNAVFADTGSLKRGAPSEPVDGLDNAKRARLAGGPPYPPMPPPPNSYAQLYTLTQDAALGGFDVKVLPTELVAQITTAILSYVDGSALVGAIAEVKSRYDQLQKQAQANAVKVAAGIPTEDDDEYDPEWEPAPAEPESTPIVAPVAELIQPDITLGRFELPKPPPLSEQQVSLVAKQSVDRVLGLVAATGPISNTQKVGLNRLAASSNDREAWATMLIRIATRAPAGLDNLISQLEAEAGEESSTPVKRESELDTPSIANGVRQTLFQYIIEDFRARINLAISWLNEEWYVERLAAKADETYSPNTHLPIYKHFTTTFLRTILPYLDARANVDTRLLIRFLSEIPFIPDAVLALVASLADDPERVSMTIMALQYLIMLRPPVRDATLDVVEGLWRGNSEAKVGATKILMRWRPNLLSQNSADSRVGAVNGSVGDPALKAESTAVESSSN